MVKLPNNWAHGAPNSTLRRANLDRLPQTGVKCIYLKQQLKGSYSR